jgi:hypothetical protein
MIYLQYLNKEDSIFFLPNGLMRSYKYDYILSMFIRINHNQIRITMSSIWYLMKK